MTRPHILDAHNRHHTTPKTCSLQPPHLPPSRRSTPHRHALSPSPTHIYITVVRYHVPSIHLKHSRPHPVARLSLPISVREYTDKTVGLFSIRCMKMSSMSCDETRPAEGKTVSVAARVANRVVRGAPDLDSKCLNSPLGTRGMQQSFPLLRTWS